MPSTLRWPTSEVMAGSERRRMRCTVANGTPALSSRVAVKCRTSCSATSVLGAKVSSVSRKAELEMVLEGPNQDPSTADPVTTLDLARAYFDLLKRIAVEHGAELDLHGVRIRKGSMVVASRPNRPDLAIQAMTDASRYIGGALPPPPKLERLVEDVRGKVIHLPRSVVATARFGEEVRPLNAHLREPQLPPRESVELRATVVTVGGARVPYARFKSRSESRPFSLRIEMDVAQRLGALLYSLVDLMAVVQRDEKGFIHAGVLEDFVPVNTSADEVKVWREWFREVGGDWNDVEDVEEELGRV
jgi:hypothetical protein